MRIAGSTILLTGATGGIGRALCRQLAQRGAVLAMVGRDATALAGLAAELRAAKVRVRPLVADIARSEVHARLVSSALELTGRIDILVNCAGVQSFSAFVDESATAAGELINVNTVAPINLTRAVLPHMLANDNGLHRLRRLDLRFDRVPVLRHLLRQQVRAARILRSAAPRARRYAGRRVATSRRASPEPRSTAARSCAWPMR